MCVDPWELVYRVMFRCVGSMPGESLCTRFGGCKELFGAGVLNERTVVQDGHVVTHKFDDSHVVADEDHREFAVLLDVLEEIKDMGLD